jgi:hypothetical protein
MPDLLTVYISDDILHIILNFLNITDIYALIRAYNFKQKNWILNSLHQLHLESIDISGLAKICSQYGIMTWLSHLQNIWKLHITFSGNPSIDSIIIKFIIGCLQHNVLKQTTHFSLYFDKANDSNNCNYLNLYIQLHSFIQKGQLPCLIYFTILCNSSWNLLEYEYTQSYSISQALLTSCPDISHISGLHYMDIISSSLFPYDVCTGILDMECVSSLEAIDLGGMIKRAININYSISTADMSDDEIIHFILRHLTVTRFPNVHTLIISHCDEYLLPVFICMIRQHIQNDTDYSNDNRHNNRTTTHIWSQITNIEFNHLLDIYEHDKIVVHHQWLEDYKSAIQQSSTNLRDRNMIPTSHRPPIIFPNVRTIHFKDGCIPSHLLLGIFANQSQTHMANDMNVYGRESNVRSLDNGLMVISHSDDSELFTFLNQYWNVDTYTIDCIDVSTFSRPFHSLPSYAKNACTTHHLSKSIYTSLLQAMNDNKFRYLTRLSITDALLYFLGHFKTSSPGITLKIFESCESLQYLDIRFQIMDSKYHSRVVTDAAYLVTEDCNIYQSYEQSLHSFFNSLRDNDIGSRCIDLILSAHLKQSINCLTNAVLAYEYLDVSVTPSKCSAAGEIRVSIMDMKRGKGPARKINLNV